MTVNVGMKMWGKCSVCDCDLLVVQTPEMAEHWRGYGVQVIVLNADTAECERCGALFSLPAAEVLDPERHSLGRFLLSLADELENKATKRNEQTLHEDDLERMGFEAWLATATPEQLAALAEWKEENALKRIARFVRKVLFGDDKTA